MIRKNYIIFLLSLTIAKFAVANVAMPGIWSAGHGSTLTPLFAKDSAAIRWIQMNKELIVIDLYKNYAVVKGTYWFLNKSQYTQQIRTGYPINGEFSATIEDMVSFEDLLYLKVEVGGKKVIHYNLADIYDSSQTTLASNQVLKAANNWYVWDMTFEPGTLTKVEVYFIVKTPAVLIQGYGRKEANAFEYILQTGANWSGNIMNGQIIINLKDGLKVTDINGILPSKRVYYLRDQLYYSFENLRPSPADDLIIWYQGTNDSISINLDTSQLYKSINTTDTAILHTTNLSLIERDNFDTPIPDWGYFIISFIVLVVGIFITLLVIIIKLIKKKLKI